MSNAEIPPLACSQVWVLTNGAVALIGDFDTWSNSRLFAETGGTSLRWREGRQDAEIVAALTKQRARLIHGPGAPWLPAEEVPHA